MKLGSFVDHADKLGQKLKFLAPELAWHRDVYNLGQSIEWVGSSFGTPIIKFCVHAWSWDCRIDAEDLTRRLKQRIDAHHLSDPIRPEPQSNDAARRASHRAAAMIEILDRAGRLLGMVDMARAGVRHPHQQANVKVPVVLRVQHRDRTGDEAWASTATDIEFRWCEIPVHGLYGERTGSRWYLVASAELPAEVWSVPGFTHLRPALEERAA